MIVKKPLLPDDNDNGHEVDIVLGGRGIGVEFCVFCTAIRVVLAQMWILVIPAWNASLKVKGTLESKNN